MAHDQNKTAPESSRKRKSNEVGETSSPSYVPLGLTQLPQFLQQGSSPTPSTTLRLDLNRKFPTNSIEESYMNIPGPYPYRSFMSLLNDEQELLPPNIRQLNNQIDGIIKSQGETLSRTIADAQKSTYKTILAEVEEKMERKLRDTELELNSARTRIVELQGTVEELKSEIRKLNAWLMQAQQSAANLKEQLEDAKKREGEGYSSEQGQRQRQQQEDSGSSNVGVYRVEPLMVPCKACGKRTSSMLMFPCQHFCICRRCDVITTNCPICQTVKTTSSQVLFHKVLDC